MRCSSRSPPHLGAPNADASIVDVGSTTLVNNIDGEGKVDNVHVDFRDAVSVTYSGYAYVARVDAPGEVNVAAGIITIGLREAQTVGVGAEITVTQGETSAKGTVAVDGVRF